MIKRRSKKFTKGGWNLILLGTAAVLIAVMTTGVSLAIYHNSGDIYLDRSRPGYLPDAGEIKDDEPIKEYELSKTGKITAADIEEYLANLDIEVKAIDAYEAPFGSEILSDEYLGITEEKPES